MSRRPDISMDAAEAAAYLRTVDAALVVAAPSQGPPVGTWAQVRGDLEQLQFRLPEDHRLVALLEADGRCCCAADQFPSYDEIKGVMLHGQATRVAGHAHGVATFVLRVDKVVSFDFSKIP